LIWIVFPGRCRVNNGKKDFMRTEIKNAFVEIDKLNKKIIPYGTDVLIVTKDEDATDSYRVEYYEATGDDRIESDTYDEQPPVRTVFYNKDDLEEFLDDVIE
jgi:hypothetical protein